LPWYRIPSTYKRDRDSILEANGGLLYAGYGDVARRYLLREHHEPAHPRSNHATEIRSPSGEYAQPRHEAVPA
jgi:fatty acid desaturase